VAYVVAKPADTITEQDNRAEPSERTFPLSDTQLIWRAKGGDRRAGDELFGRYYQMAYGLAYTMCSGDREEAKDVVQDAFIKVFRNLKSFKEDASFYTWLYRIVVNTCLDRRRGQSRWKKLFSTWPLLRSRDGLADEPYEVEDPKEESNPLHKLENKETGKRIERAIMALPENQRIAFHLKVVEGLKIREIAEIMGSAEGTVKTHIFRAMRNLQESLKELGDP